MNKVFSFFLFLAFYFFSFASQAASSIDVPPDDPSYRYLDLLTAHGLVKTAIYGQRPYSRDEVARLIREARDQWNKRKENDTWIESVLVWLENQFRTELNPNGRKNQRVDIHVLKSLQYQFTYLHSDPKIFPTNNGLGPINATSQPFVAYREGRHYSKGAQYSIESEHGAHITPYTSYYVRPRFEFQFPENNQADSSQAFIQEAYGVINFHNFEIQFGRSSLLEGQGENGGLILSDNARPLDHVQISNDHPIVLPWIFKYLGENKFMTFYANLGPEYSAQYAHFVGYKWSFKPLKQWEMGVANAFIFGGEGVQSIGVSQFIKSYYGFIDPGTSASNRILGFDTRIGISFLRGTQFFAEFFLDDKSWKSLKRTFFDTSAYYAGFDIPRLNDSGTLHARLEFHYLSELFYRHSLFQNGYTLNQMILGDPLGPDGRRGMVEIGWNIKPETELQASFTYDHSDSNIYQDNGGQSVTVTQDNPLEQRFRFVSSFQHRFNRRVLLKNSVGYERVSNFNYNLGDDRNNYLAELGLIFNFDPDFSWKH